MSEFLETLIVWMPLPAEGFVAREILETLMIWTPFLAEGFAMNVLVTLASIAIGAVLGLPLAMLRLDGGPLARRLARVTTEVARNVPTFVFLLYVAYILPVEITLFDQLVVVPPWIKASLALSVAVVGFTSDNVLLTLRHWRQGDRGAALLLFASASSFLVIMLMASSTASAIGVDEIVSRCNILIAAVGGSWIMVAAYAYAMLWFLLAALILNVLLARMRVLMARRLGVHGAAA